MFLTFTPFLFQVNLLTKILKSFSSSVSLGCMYVFYVCVFLCITVFISCNLGAALRALTKPCMSRSPIVHCHFMLLFMNE